ncbi:L-ascorbate oxidase-like protein [Senna tora]|uniref:L-ascorbate oxidase-like protein n=1 Tax=Senna tora TaxID=362788 RepID=A0A834WKZ7_9FABA|nr:L-ascorbate oxidase-like protein [Senna tora]
MVYLVIDIVNISNIHVILLDSGNLLLLNNSNLNILWQSFDYLTDTLLPGMNVGVDFTSGMSWSLRSWKNEEDPSLGLFSLEVEEDDNYMYEKLIIRIKKGSEIYWIGDELSNFTFQSYSYNRQSNTIRKQGYLIGKGNILLDWQGEFLCVKCSNEEERIMISKERDRWNINYYTHKSAMPLLDTINYHPHIKNLSSQDLEQLATELRTDIVHIVSKIGGHLSSSLGVVELSMALHHVFHTPSSMVSSSIAKMQKAIARMRFHNHPMKLVEIEGSHTVQNNYDSLDIHVGQFFTVVVTTNKEPKDYYLVASTHFYKSTAIGKFVIRYKNRKGPASPELPKALVGWACSLNHFHTFRWNLTAINSLSRNEGKLRYALNGVCHVDPETQLKLEDYYGVTKYSSTPTCLTNHLPT